MVYYLRDCQVFFCDVEGENGKIFKEFDRRFDMMLNIWL